MMFARQRTLSQNASWVRDVGKFLVSPSNYVFPNFVITQADSERAVVDQFILSIRAAQPGELLLDAGAGNFRFKESLIEKDYIYESQDFEQVFDQNSRGKHTYVCDITSIPAESNRFGVVVCTQVLEHLPDPLGALKELARVLKPGGELFLTTNLLFPIHGAPYDFFRFTNFGLEYLCRESGYSNIEVVPRGGFFRLCAKVIYDFPAIATSWLFFGGSSPHGQRELRIRSWPLVVVLTPAIFILDVISTLVAYLVSKLDRFDRKRRFTLGYQLRATID
jgi:SAM-dependent methyltransferase